MARVKFVKLFGSPQAPQFSFLLPPPKAPLPRRAREIPPKAGVLRVLNNYILFNRCVAFFKVKYCNLLFIIILNYLSVKENNQIKRSPMIEQKYTHTQILSDSCWINRNHIVFSNYPLIWKMLVWLYENYWNIHLLAEFTPENVTPKNVTSENLNRESVTPKNVSLVHWLTNSLAYVIVHPLSVVNAHVLVSTCENLSFSYF